MKRAKYFFALLGCLVIGYGGYAYYNALQARGTSGGVGRPGGPGGPGGNRPPSVVSTASIEQGAMAVRAEFIGTLQAHSLADLYAKSSGPLIEIRAETGDYVRAGQVLAIVDDASAEQGVKQAQAALRMAKATLSQRESALTIARNRAERSAALFAKKLTSEQDQDAAQAELLSAQAQVELALAQVEQAEANLGAAQLAFQNTRITAPFKGVIGKRYLDLGAHAATNRPVFSIADLSSIKITISLTEKDAALVQVGQPAEVTTDAFPGILFTGRVARISPVFNPQTNTTEAEIEIANSDGRLKPGMFATVSVAYRTGSTALLVPKAAVLQNGKESVVFVVEKKADEKTWTARQIPVRLIGTTNEGKGDRVAIDGDLARGTHVITLGHEQLRDGAPIVLSNAAPADSLHASRQPAL